MITPLLTTDWHSTQRHRPDIPDLNLPQSSGMGLGLGIIKTSSKL
jgi:hypothetical protein